MFLPTKAHEKILGDGSNRLRIGNKVPDGAVGIAYVYSAPLTPDENIQVVDMSGFILENLAAEGIEDIDRWPNDQGLLLTWDGNPYITGRNFLLTDAFYEGKPLYYRHVLTYPVAPTKDIDSNGFYTGKAIYLVDKKGNPLSSDYRYRIRLLPNKEKGKYEVHIFTDFQTQPSVPIKAIYTAYMDNKYVPGHSELLQPRAAYKGADTIDKAVRTPGKGMHYYQGEGRNLGQTQLFVPSVPIRDISSRVPMYFRYRITATAQKDGETITAQTPWIYDTVLNAKSLTLADDEYFNGHKRLNESTAMEIVAEWGDTTPFEDPENEVFFIIESSEEDVMVYTQPDGKGAVFAYTERETGKLRLPDQYRKQYRARNVIFDVAIRVDGGETEIVRDTLSIMDGHKAIAGPFGGEKVEITLLRPYDPVTIYVEDGVLYAFTNEIDLFYVPRWSVRTSDNSQIKTLPPVEKRQTENWYARIQSGQFERESQTKEGLFIKHRYAVPEYYKQPFEKEEGMPYKKVIGEQPEIVGKHQIRLRHTPLHIQRNEQGIWNIEIFINSISIGVKSWDLQEGIVEVDVRLKSSDHILVNYYYEEYSFTYRGYWDEENQQFWHLDLNPGVGHYYTDMDERTKEIREMPTFRLINKTIYLYMRPNLRFGDNGEIIRGSYKERVLFHSFKEIQDPYVLLLGKIYVRPNSSIDSVQLVDVRKRGGGLKEHISKTVMNQMEPESNYYWDIGFWDGEPYSENGVIVVQLSSSVLRENGGKMTKEEVERAIKRHVGFGNLPIIEYKDDPVYLLQSPLHLSGEKITEGE